MLAVLTQHFGTRPTGPNIFAYLAAIAAHPGYTSTFAADLTNPGLRIPITADAQLFAAAVELGRAVIWLHTSGQRYVDPAQERPAELLE